MMPDQYNILKERLRHLEKIDTETAVMQMVDLYGDILNTTYHDLANAIELWVD